MGKGTETPTAADVASVLSGWATAGGVISMALFPFAIPLIALTAIAALPLVLVALPVVVLAVPVLAGRALVRKIGAARRGRLRTRAPYPGGELVVERRAAQP